MNMNRIFWCIVLVLLTIMLVEGSGALWHSKEVRRHAEPMYGHECELVVVYERRPFGRTWYEKSRFYSIIE